MSELSAIKAKNAYLIGIKGVGMTALAIFLKQAGFEVSGSDTAEVFVTDKLLKENGINFYENFDEKNLHTLKYDLIIISAAYDDSNVEVSEAMRRKMNVKYYSEVLGEITSGKKTIAVAGIHGKTTTTAMLALILEKANLDPSFIIGSGEVPNFKTNAKKGSGDYFVVEADEYRKSPKDNTPKFLDLNPQIAIISSIELDHPDVFATEEDVYNAFYSLVCRVPRNGSIILCLDYMKSKKLLRSIVDRNFETYGFDPTSKWRIVNVKQENDLSVFSIESSGQVYGPFKMQLPGNHNILNATAATVTALKIGISESVVKNALEDFKSVKRRFEVIGKVGEITVIDDYAHHPTAIIRTLEAAKRKYVDSKIWCIFQPHTFSRTEKLLDEFSLSFKSADQVIVTDIFASAREAKGKITAEDLVEKIKKSQSKVKYIADQSEIEKFILANVKEPAVIMTIGAGDIYQLGQSIFEKLSERNEVGKK